MANFLQANQNTTQLLCQSYEKEQINAGVIHLGVGAFHRAHQAVYFDQLLNLSEQQNWGIIGVNIRPQDSEIFAKLTQQQGEYVLKTMSAVGQTKYQHIRSLVKLIDGAKQASQVDKAMASPNIQLVTSTVTEGGYYLDEHHKLLAQHPAIAGDIQGQRHTLYAFLYEGLKLRSQSSAGKITLLCCDNLRHNGKLLQTGLMQFIAVKQDAQLATWVDQNVSFPCSMVDRITPKPNQQHLQDVQQRFTIDDQMTVMAEDFIQWVVEDNFAGLKPALDKVGVEFVEDVEPYEEAKIRILNAGHTCITYQAALKNLQFFDEAMQDSSLNQYFHDFIEQEVRPGIGESAVDLAAYAKKIAERFSNKNIGDTIERICGDGYAKFPVFVYPTLLANYQQGQTPSLALQGIASWYCFLQAEKQRKLSFPYHEPNKAALTAFYDNEQGIETFVNHSFLWGEVINLYPQFKADLKLAINKFKASL
ncbi:mannitol dehydrogenase family protein [Marinomonas sp. THO17]|uniref:mannitol dehydrogenase family protein n=1 Tax=Marinomonas sp. THO17 TaxID=3149048 RepID=UPI00336C2503